MLDVVKVHSLTIAVLILAISSVAKAECQAPCDSDIDRAQFQAMYDDVAMLKKAANMMKELKGKADSESKRQGVRWENVREKHVQNIINTISNYFLTYRVKFSQFDSKMSYGRHLILHHDVILTAEKVRSTNIAIVEDLHDKIWLLERKYQELGID